MAVKEKKVANSEQLVLENRVIKVVPILRNKAFFKKDHDGNHTYTGCWKGWGLPFVITSYSIHYTKLYDYSDPHPFPPT